MQAVHLVHGAHRDRFSGRGQVCWVDRVTVDQQCAYLGEWHAQGLHDVSERRDAVDPHGRSTVAVCGGDEQSQFGGELDRDLWSGHTFSMAVLEVG